MPQFKTYQETENSDKLVTVFWSLDCLMLKQQFLYMYICA